VSFCFVKAELNRQDAEDAEEEVDRDFSLYPKTKFIL
jgi:hypothetical protein